MLQITASLESLSPAQREALSDFILSFPAALEVTEDDEEVVTIPAFTVQAEDDLNQDAAAIFGAPLLETVFKPVAAAGPVLVPTPPAPASDNDRLDKSGIPWDERIHASSRAKTADGSWRMKRGVDPALAVQVEGELKQLMALPGVVQAIPAPPPPVTVAAIPAPPVTAAVVEDRQAYVKLISKASAAIGAKTLTTEQLTAAVVAAGVPSLPLLANRLDLVPQVMAAIETMIG